MVAWNSRAPPFAMNNFYCTPAVLIAIFFSIRAAATSSLSLVSGPCEPKVINGMQCVTSPNYPGRYNYNQKCTMWGGVGHALWLDAFNLRTGIDALFVNGVAFSGQTGPNGTSLQSPYISWSSGHSGDLKCCKFSGNYWTDGLAESNSWSICVRSKPSMMFSVSGPCSNSMEDENYCVSSPGYPHSYDNSQSCEIQAAVGHALLVKAFDTEAGSDIFYVNGQGYSGLDSPQSIVVHNQTLSWSSGGLGVRPGWKICLSTQKAYSGLGSPQSIVVHNQTPSWSSDSSGVRPGWKICLSTQNLPSMIEQLPLRSLSVLVGVTGVCLILMHIVRRRRNKYAARNMAQEITDLEALPDLPKELLEQGGNVSTSSSSQNAQGPLSPAPVATDPCSCNGSYVSLASKANVDDSFACGMAPVYSRVEDSSDGSWEKLDDSDQDVSSCQEVQRLLPKASVDCVKCFLPNTAFKSLDGGLLLASHVQEGNRVRLSSGSEAVVVSVLHHARSKYPITELVTRQGHFKVSATHRVVVMVDDAQEVRQARELMKGDKVIVGEEARQLTRVTHSEEKTELYGVSFFPDQPVEAFMIPTRGIQSHGEDVNGMASTSEVAQQVDSSTLGMTLMHMFASVSETELLRAMPLDYTE